MEVVGWELVGAGEDGVGGMGTGTWEREGTGGMAASSAGWSSCPGESNQLPAGAKLSGSSLSPSGTPATLPSLTSQAFHQPHSSSALRTTSSLLFCSHCHILK